MPAMPTVGPADFLEPPNRRVLVREHLGQFHQADPFAMGLAGCFLCYLSFPPLSNQYRELGARCFGT